MRMRLFRSLFLLSFLVAAASPASAVVGSPSLIVGPPIPLPGVNAADVATAGSAVFVGQGTFGAGQQSIIRRDLDGTTTTVVTDLNALGGLAYDAEGDRLLFTDNGGDLVGAASGDTVYALPDPRAVAAPIDAATLTLLPSGSIPFAQAVLPLPGGDVLIGDAAGPGAGRVVKLAAGVPTDFIVGLDYVAGVSLTPDQNYVPNQQIQVGNVDGSFVASVKRYSLAGAPLGTVNQSPIGGALDQAVDAAGNLFVTGGFTDDFSSSTLTSVVQAGGVEQVASGFGFSSGIAIDGPSQRILVLDFGQTHVDTLLPVLWLTPGKFFGRRECHLEEWGSPYDVSRNGKPRSTWTCTDGDPACDRDLAANGTCDFLLGACLHVEDQGRTRDCEPVDVEAVHVTSKKLPAAASVLQAAVDAVLPATGAVCSEANVVTVPADKRTRTITLDAFAAGKRLDKDVLKLRCLP